jgi:hypothetical protein
MSSLSWDFPSSSTNPVGDDEDMDEVDGRGRPEGASDDHDENGLVDLLEQEQSEREELEELERQLLEQLAREQVEGPERDQLEQLEREQVEARARERGQQPGQLEEADHESPALSGPGEDDPGQSGRSEREQLEELEREQLRLLERLPRHPDIPLGGAPGPSATASAERPRPAVPAREAPSAPVAEPPGVDAAARAAQFLAASERRARAEQATSFEPSAPTTERRELSEPARAARAIVEHRHRNLVEANALLTEARRVLAPIAYRGLSDRIYRRRKVILAIGEAVSLAVAFSAAFDVAPLEALLLSGAIALAFVIAGDLGGIMRLTAERSRLSAAMEDEAVHLDPRYLHILYHDRQPWLSIIGGVTAGIFALAAVTVGVLRAANRGSLGLAAGLGLLTLSLAIAAGLSSWQHASVGSEIIDHLQREEEAAARRLKRAAAARVLRRPQILTAVRTDELELPSLARDDDWSAPDVDWQAPPAEPPARRARRGGGRPARQKPAKREKGAGSGLVGAAAARGAVFLATLPGKLRRSEKASGGGGGESVEEMSVGDGPGALGESAGPISAVVFRPPVQVPKKFG